MTDDQKATNIQHLVTKFSALTCPSDTHCNKCIGVLTVYNAYHGLGIPMASCDKCDQTLYKTDVILHCPPNYKHHNEGYDLCVNCGHKMLKKQQKAQQTILRQLSREKKRKNRENDTNNTDSNGDPPKKKRKRGRPRKYPLQSDSNKTESKHTNHTYRDWEEQLMDSTFCDNYMKYLRTVPNIHENSIKIINRYSSWLDFTRLNEGSEINILNVLSEFESIVNAHSNANLNINPQLLKELNSLNNYLSTSEIDYRHIWSDTKTNPTQINEHSAIAKYASNYIAHNSIHNTLFGADGGTNEKRVEWSVISQMIEQSHFIRDWKLYNFDQIIQKQIDILQSLIAQHSTNKNNLAHNSSVFNQSDLRINIWKKHVLKLRNIRMNANVGLEFPMNLLRFDRTEIDHIAKVSAITGIQHLLNEKTKNKPLLPVPQTCAPQSNNSNNSNSNSSLKLRDLLPNSEVLNAGTYKAPFMPNMNRDNSNGNQANTVNLPRQRATNNNSNFMAQNRVNNNRIQFQATQQQNPLQKRSQQRTQIRTNNRVYTTPANNTQINNRINTQNNIIINPLQNSTGIDLSRLLQSFQNNNANNPQIRAFVSNQKNTAVLNQIAAHLLSKRTNIFAANMQPINTNNLRSHPTPNRISNPATNQNQNKISNNLSLLNNKIRSMYTNTNNNTMQSLNPRISPNKAAQNLIANKRRVTTHLTNASDNDSSDIEIVKVNLPTRNHAIIPKLKELPTLLNQKGALQRMKSSKNNPKKKSKNTGSAIDLTTNSPPPPHSSRAIRNKSTNSVSSEPIIKAVTLCDNAPKQSATTNNRKISPPIEMHNVTQVYSDKKYWEKFHSDQKNECFEWFCNYDDISYILDRHISNKNAKILEIGCGLSAMASKMALNGYTNLLCLDWCDSAIHKIQSILNAQYAQDSRERAVMDECIQYTVQDIRGMNFERRTFDVVIDKGTLDAIDCGVSLERDLETQGKLSGSGAQNLSDNFDEIVGICGRVHEILKPNGLFILVTSRSIAKRIEFVDELKASHKRHFRKVYAENVKTELKDWRDGDSKTPKLIILKADKNSRKHKHKT